MAAFILMLAAVIGLSAWIAMLGIRELIAGFQAVEMPPARVESPEEKWPQVREAFSGEGEVGVDAATLLEIERSLDDVVRTMSRENDAAFRRRVDMPRLLEQVKSSGVIGSLTGFRQSSLMSHIRSETLVPLVATRYRIAKAYLFEDDGEAVVYVTFWSDDDVANELRWWVRRSDAGWKVFDWEFIGFGMPWSRMLALTFEHSSSPEMREYDYFLNEMLRADELIERSDYAEAASHLRIAQTRKVHPELADNSAMMVAAFWVQAGFHREAIVAAKRVAAPDQTPLTYLILSYAYAGLGMHEDALMHACRFARQAGDGPSACEQIALSLDALDRRKEADVYWRKLLRHDPGNAAAREALAYSADSGSADEPPD